MNAIAQPSAVPSSGPQLDNRRVLAAVIDLVVVAAGVFAIGFAAGVYGAEGTSLALSLVFTAWALYYYFACESGGGQTLGKKVMKLRVVKLDGSAPGMGDIGLRTALRMIDGLLLYLVGLIVMLATGKRRGRLGDLAAGTMVVSTDGAVAAPPNAEAAPNAPTIRLPARGPESVTAVASTPDPVVEREPVAEVEPVVEQDPIVEEHEPVVVEVEPFRGEPDPVVEIVPAFEHEPVVVEVEPFRGEPVVETEPAVEAEPVMEALPGPLYADSEPLDEPVPVYEPVPEFEDEPDVVVKSVETVSAIDLIMGEDEPDEDSPGAGPEQPPA